MHLLEGTSRCSVQLVRRKIGEDLRRQQLVEDVRTHKSNLIKALPNSQASRKSRPQLVKASASAGPIQKELLAELQRTEKLVKHFDEAKGHAELDLAWSRAQDIWDEFRSGNATVPKIIGIDPGQRKVVTAVYYDPKAEESLTQPMTADFQKF
jgi:hypothetical protein